MPQRCALINDPVLAMQGIRYLPYKNYYVFFVVIEEVQQVLIARIGYNRRNWKEILLSE